MYTLFVFLLQVWGQESQCRTIIEVTVHQFTRAEWKQRPFNSYITGNNYSSCCFSKRWSTNKAHVLSIKKFEEGLKWGSAYISQQRYRLIMEIGMHHSFLLDVKQNPGVSRSQRFVRSIARVKQVHWDVPPSSAILKAWINDQMSFHFDY